jgi:hypothetical protein
MWLSAMKNFVPVLRVSQIDSDYRSINQHTLTRIYQTVRDISEIELTLSILANEPIILMIATIKQITRTIQIPVTYSSQTIFIRSFKFVVLNYNRNSTISISNKLLQFIECSVTQLSLNCPITIPVTSAVSTNRKW